MKAIVSFIVASLLMVTAACGEEEGEPAPTEAPEVQATDTAPPPTESAENAAFVVGDEAADVLNISFGQTAQIGDSQVTALALNFPTDAEPVDVVGAGERAFPVEFSVKNIGTEAMSSLLGERTIKVVDAQGNQYDPVSTGAILDSPIASGASITGGAVFIVPEGATGLMFAVSEPAGADEARWQVPLP